LTNAEIWLKLSLGWQRKNVDALQEDTSKNTFKKTRNV